MIAAASVIAVVIVSLLITRVATVVLTLTGLSRESARFQARSALSGVGFTTSEAEGVVNHPVRRRVVMLLMLLGSAGIVTVVATLIISLGSADAGERTNRVAVVVAGLLVLWLLARSSWVDRRLSSLIAAILDRKTDLNARDYSALLHLSANYMVLEMAVRDGDWVAGRTLAELRLRDEGVLVLGLTRPGGTYTGAPRFDTRIQAGDTLLLYGRSERLAELDDRQSGASGDEVHEQAVEEHRERAPHA